MSALPALTPALAAPIQQSINSLVALLTPVTTAPQGVYTRTQVSQARLALSYYATLSQNVKNLISSQPSVQYAVQQGDTLPLIAQMILGDATLYKAIMRTNNLSDHTLLPGLILTMPILQGNP